MSEVPDTQAFLDPDASREYLRSWKNNVDRMATQAAAMSEQMKRLRVTARDENGLAEVTIDSAGVMVGLELTDRIHRFEPAVVAQAVMTALHEARATAADRAHDIAVETMGPDSLSARTTADRMRQVLERPDDSRQAAEDAPAERGY
ncbi:YbaB/EbfC family nucleoid-associated protein [Actinoplanes sp. NPDC051411]|uniref:YbaB/EbfC family nucleoid-associated protein n=1 Tax=Actinoplanes sp. NPDC051411 TaxID=3155522 RepID=UPI00344913E5